MVSAKTPVVLSLPRGVLVTLPALLFLTLNVSKHQQGLCWEYHDTPPDSGRRVVGMRTVTAMAETLPARSGFSESVPGLCVSDHATVDLIAHPGAALGTDRSGSRPLRT